MNYFSPMLLAVASCRVNWFGQSTEVAWYWVAIPVVIIASVAYTAMLSRTYVCPHCGIEFKPKWYHLFVSIHANGKRLAKCPHCGKMSYCRKK